MNEFHFDWSISLGNIVTAISVVSGFLALYARLVRMELRVEVMWDRFTTAVLKANGGTK